jgi:hypothetical protein
MCTVSCNPWVRCRVQTRPPPLCILGHIKPIHARPSCIKIHFNIIFPLTRSSSRCLLHWGFSAERPYIFVFCILPSTSCPSNGPRYGHQNNIGKRHKSINLPIMLFPPLYWYFLPLGSKYVLQRHILEHLQSVLFLKCRRPGFAPIQKNIQNNTSVFKLT